MATSMFRELGAHIIDADEICRNLVQPGCPALQKIADTFGDEILLEDHSLDRSKLAHIVFNDPEKKKRLESILHPKVFAEETKIYEEIKKKEPNALVIIDASLMFESGHYKEMDKTVVVSCDCEKQMQRVIKRSHLDRAEVKKRLRSQMSLEEKTDLADYILDNSSSVGDLRIGVENLYQKLKTLT